MHEQHREDLGVIAAELLKALEYRGYDSTGAAVQGDGEEVILRKGVGAPSDLVESLGIVDLEGSLLCGQVRWATFGAVDDANAQPHVVHCKAHLYGAHNGNVTNTDELKAWLSAEGHEVLSDNDGEMVVHTIEHFFAAELDALTTAARDEVPARRQAMRRAIAHADQRLRGSFAAVIIDPRSRVAWAIKRGSSLYVGLGSDAKGGRYGLASSDLSAVLKQTRVLVPLVAGEAIEMDGASYQVFSLESGEPTLIDRPSRRSRLRAKDTELVPPFETFMDQEIHAQVETCRDVIRLIRGGSEQALQVAPIVDALAEDERMEVHTRLDNLLVQRSAEDLKLALDQLATNPAVRAMMHRVPAHMRVLPGSSSESAAEQLRSSEAGFFADLISRMDDPVQQTLVRLLDAYLEHDEVRSYQHAVNGFCQRFLETAKRGGRAYLVCCGTSFHAAKAASLFFSEIAKADVLPLLPGEFRGQHLATLRDGDLLIAVSQSGETKDLVDVIDLANESGVDLSIVSLVNNVNSTLAEEKSELVIPLHCGPEIAVPATKSFLNQLTVFYCLALRLAERRLTSGHEVAGQASDAELERRMQALPELPDLIANTLAQTRTATDEAAQLLFLSPSMHLLATRLLGVAREGALKIREVVLNHAEGFEGSEFKHGPNTILGFNTVLGPQQVERLLERIADAVDEALRSTDLTDREQLGAVARDTVLSAFRRSDAAHALDGATVREALYADYPLIYITGPDPRDVALTVSQMNTHKIRGAITIVVAEDDPELRAAAENAPASNPSYRSVYIPLPKTGDTLMTTFSATVALQTLALKMSVKKMTYLDNLGIAAHGVHPDVPKNVSKSITVD